MRAFVPFLGVTAFVAMVAFAVYSFVANRKRREALFAFATGRGWSYSARDDSYCSRWPGQPFGVGHRPSARNVVIGRTGAYPTVAFDYTYVTETTDSNGNRRQQTHEYSIVALAMPAPLGLVSVTPESVAQRLAGAFGVGRDIELESADFNGRFAVHANNPKLASDVLTPRLMQYLLSVPPTSWRFVGSDVVSWEQGTLQPVDIIRRAATLSRVVDSVPRFVWKDHGYDPPTIPEGSITS